MKAIDRAKTHFASLDPEIIEVPQWADETGAPLLIHVNPLTVKDRDKLSKIEDRVGPGLELIVHGLILYARDEAGEPLFTMADKPDLMNRVDPEIVLAIGAAMFTELDPEVIKKKSSQTAPYASA